MRFIGKEGVLSQAPLNPLSLTDLFPDQWLIRWWNVRQPQLLPHERFYIAAGEKESADARILCGFDIAFSIPEKDRPVFVYAVCIKRTKDHPRRRLAAAPSGNE